MPSQPDRTTTFLFIAETESSGASPKWDPATVIAAEEFDVPSKRYPDTADTEGFDPSSPERSPVAPAEADGFVASLADRISTADTDGFDASPKRRPDDPADAIADAPGIRDDFVRAGVESRGGRVFKEVGDSFFSAFDAAPDALEAALAIHRAALSRNTRVKMAIHTGEAEERDGDFFGAALSRVARLLSAAHGGQILLSSATRERLPNGVGVRDFGERKLKDIAGTHRVYKAVAPSVSLDSSPSPPIKTLDARPANLPARTTAVIGRVRETDEACERLRREDPRLLVLTGTGGSGKTSLALRVAAEILDEFEGGAFFVPLASVADAAFVAPAIARTLGVEETAGRSHIESIEAAVGGRELLIVLDNLEHLPAAAIVADELLAACPGMKILATSRASLPGHNGSRGSRARRRSAGKKQRPCRNPPLEYLVPPLALPSAASEHSIEALARCESVRLFVERARDVKFGFGLTDGNAPDIAGICRRLDGLPLAIELAAARVRMLPPGGILTRLADRMKLLADGARDLPERHRSLRGAIAWSHDLLGGKEKFVFRRLAVFSGGCTPEAAGEVCGFEAGTDIYGELRSLEDKSLIHHEQAPDGEPRFTMLETIREYAKEKLEAGGEAEEADKAHGVRESADTDEGGDIHESASTDEAACSHEAHAAAEAEGEGVAAVKSGIADEAEEARLRHAEYFLAFAEEGGTGLRGPRQVEWMAALEADHDNIRAALSWSLEEPGRTALALRISAAMGWFWNIGGHMEEGWGWLKESLEKANDAPDGVRAAALNGAGYISMNLGHLDRADSLLEKALGIGRKLGEKSMIATSLTWLGMVALYRGDSSRAEERSAESLENFREVGDEWGYAGAATILGSMVCERGAHDWGRPLLEEALEIYRGIGDDIGAGAVLNNLGYLALFSGDYEGAASYLEDSFVITWRLGNKWYAAAGGLCNLGHAKLLAGDPGAAEELYREAISLCREQSQRMILAECLEGMAALLAQRGDALRAASLLGAADALSEAMDFSLIELRSLLSPFLEKARARLGDAEWEGAVSEGRGMTFEGSISRALEERLT